MYELEVKQKQNKVTPLTNYGLWSQVEAGSRSSKQHETTLHIYMEMYVCVHSKRKLCMYMLVCMCVCVCMHILCLLSGAETILFVSFVQVSCLYFVFSVSVLFFCHVALCSSPFFCAVSVLFSFILIWQQYGNKVNTFVYVHMCLKGHCMLRWAFVCLCVCVNRISGEK